VSIRHLVKFANFTSSKFKNHSGNRVQNLNQPYRTISAASFGSFNAETGDGYSVSDRNKKFGFLNQNIKQKLWWPKLKKNGCQGKNIWLGMTWLPQANPSLRDGFHQTSTFHFAASFIFSRYLLGGRVAVLAFKVKPF